MLPYENATSGESALDDMQNLLRGFGASSFGCTEDYEHGEEQLQIGAIVILRVRQPAAPFPRLKRLHMEL